MVCLYVCRFAQVVAAATDLAEAAKLLVREAIDARCGDNTTVVLVRMSKNS